MINQETPVSKEVRLHIDGLRKVYGLGTPSELSLIHI